MLLALEHLPEAMRPRVRRVLDEAWGLADAALAKRRLLQLAAGLDATHAGAAASLREGFDETPTLQRVGVTGALYRTPRSTNAIENLNGLVGDVVRHVRRWRHGRMLVRWIAAGLLEVTRSFRRVHGHRDLAALIRALDRPSMDSRKEVASGPSPEPPLTRIQQRAGHPLWARSYPLNRGSKPQPVMLYGNGRPTARCHDLRRRAGD